MEDNSFKSLAVIGMCLGFAAWLFTGKAPTASRAPSAASVEVQARVKSEASYVPSIPTTDERDSEVSVSVTNDAAAPTAPNNEAGAEIKDGEAVAVSNENSSASEYSATRNEIAKILAQGDVEAALEVAEKKLEETVQVQNPEIAYVGYLHEFIMENSDDPDTEVNVTISAMKGTQDRNVRKFIYDKFQSYSPQLVEDLDRELDSAGISVTN